jgi:hypothetical protein
MSPLSSDPDKRAVQLANLRPTPPPAGNVRALKHGAKARQATLIAAGSWSERIYAELEAEAPLRAADGGLPAADRQAVELLASVLARLQAAKAWLDTRPAADEKGRPWPVADDERRLIREAGRLLDQLGMTPRSRAALGLDLIATVDLARAWANEEQE